MNKIDATAAVLAASPDDGMICNRTFEEIFIGETASLTKQVTMRDIELLAIVSGDVNPIHLDEEFARNSVFHKVIAHGVYGAALISAVLGAKLPGPGTVYLGQDIRYLQPVGIGDTLTVVVTVTAKNETKGDVTFDCNCVNQNGLLVLTGVARVRAPTEKLRVTRPELPDVQISGHERFHALMARVRGLPPVATAVAYPCDPTVISAAAEAAEAGLISPILVGPREKILVAAAAAGVDCSAFRLVDAKDSMAAAMAAVSLVRRGEAQALMAAGDAEELMHSTDLLHAVLDRQAGLVGKRRLSHVYLIDAPAYPRPLLLTDAAINIVPDLDAKRDIIQNAVDLAHILGVAQPRVALLSALGVVNPNLPSSLDAAALCKMADRGQITGALLDGPLGFDNALSPDSARERNLPSAVAGQADILVAPNLEAGDLLVKQLTLLAGAHAAAVVLGARAPIIVTSRSDSVRTLLASCAIAGVIARASA